MSAAVRCYRFPCDTAYRQGSHTPGENGLVLHEVKWGNQSRKARPDEFTAFPNVWEVSAIAWGEQPWEPWVYLEGGQHSFPSGAAASLFIEKLSIAMACALDANVREATEAAEAMRLNDNVVP